MALQQALVRMGQERGALGRRAGEDRDGLGPLALVAAEEHGRLAGVVVVVDGEQEAAARSWVVLVVADDVAVVVAALQGHLRGVSIQFEVAARQPQLAPPRDVVVEVELRDDLGLHRVRRGEGARVEAEAWRAAHDFQERPLRNIKNRLLRRRLRARGERQREPRVPRRDARDAAPREPTGALGEESGRELLDVRREAGVVARFVHQNKLFARVLGRVVARHAQTCVATDAIDAMPAIFDR